MTDHPAPPGLPTTGPHVFVAPFGSDTDILIDGASGHHLASVLRVRTGQAISLADDTGAVFQAVVTQTGRDSVTLEVANRFQIPSPLVPLTLVQGLPKGRKMDEVVQRATEVGVARIVPVITSRCVKQPAGKDDKLLARWRAVALAASQQSRRARVPVIAPISQWPPVRAVGVIAWERATAPIGPALEHLLSDPAAYAALRSDGCTVAIGPEGGFASHEVEVAGGLHPVSLGSTILRTETAGIVALALAGEGLMRTGYA